MPTLHDVQAALGLIGGLETLWPGFEPANTPLLVWDGVQTTLLQAGQAPASAWQPWPDGWALPHRHPALVANTAVTLEDGSDAAAVLLTELPPGTSVRDLAALIVHESFHVYQRHHGPERWQADELAIFGYPLNRDVLTSRRLELLALKAALGDAAGWRGHAAEALHWREQRWPHLTPAQQELERGLERREGLAHLTELGVGGEPPDLPLPDFPPAQVRRRCYSTGAVLALLLERVGEWKGEFMTSTLGLDEMLRGRLAQIPRSGLRPEQVEQASAGATLDAQTVRAEVQGRRRAYEQRPGPRLTLTSASPIWPQGFDPQNISDLGGGRLLHHRFLRFGTAHLSGEVLGREVLSVATGAHPLQGGFTSLLLTALAEVQVWQEHDTLRVEARGAGLQISGGWTAEEDSQGWVVTVP